uniref:Uncharacterized protein n=1 Tax=Panagrolaimus superbus TaxID=310955 RepID=A0A914YQI9_9BILA
MIRQPRFFNSSSRLSECLRELPLGHHIFAQFGNGERYKDSKSRKSIFVVKGGRQNIPLNNLFGAFMHPNITKISQVPPKNTTTEEAAAKNKNKVTLTRTKTKTKTIDATTTTAPTQASVTMENPEV